MLAIGSPTAAAGSARPVSLGYDHIAEELKLFMVNQYVLFGHVVFYSFFMVFYSILANLFVLLWFVL